MVMVMVDDDGGGGGGGGGGVVDNLYAAGRLARGCSSRARLPAASGGLRLGAPLPKSLQRGELGSTVITDWWVDGWFGYLVIRLFGWLCK